MNTRGGKANISEAAWAIVYAACAFFTYIHWLKIQGLRFVPEMLAGTAPKPYAYRILIPKLIVLFKTITGQSVNEIYILHIICFAALIASFYAMRYLFSLFFDEKRIYSQLFPVFVSFFLIPFFRDWDAYIYDFPVLLFSTLLIICIKVERIWWYYALFLLSCLNK